MNPYSRDPNGAGDLYAVGGGPDAAEAARRQRLRLIVGGAILFSGVVILGIAFFLFQQARQPQPVAPAGAGNTAFAAPPSTGVPIVPLVVGVFGFFDLVLGLGVMAFGLPGMNRARPAAVEGAASRGRRRRDSTAAAADAAPADQAQAAAIISDVAAVTRAPAKLGNWLLGGIFMLVGLSVCLGGVWMYFSTKTFIARAVRVPGVVTALDSHRDSDGDTMYSPVYEYDDLQGQHHKVTSSQSSHPAAFDVGEQVEVLYEPDDPEDSKIDSFIELWLVPTILIPFGAIFLLIGSGASGLFGAVRRRLTGSGVEQPGAELTPRLPAESLATDAADAANPYAATDAPVQPTDDKKGSDRFGSGAKYD